MNKLTALYQVSCNVGHLVKRGGFLDDVTRFGYSHIRYFKSALKIKWVRPAPLKPYHASKTGDLVPIDTIQPDALRVEFQNNPELMNADETVKKVFSLEFQLPVQKYMVYSKQLADKVRRHKFDRGSPEVKIAQMTARVRYLQEYMETHPSDKKRKVQLLEVASKRKKNLKYLRRWDYKRFEWLLEKLDLEYRPQPKAEMVARRKSLTMLTELHCATIKEERLAAYKTLLNQRKLPFLENKIAKLKWIQEEEAKFKLAPSVYEAEIDECVKQLEQVKLELAEYKGTVKPKPVHVHTAEVYDL